jgi:hypothetical protein
VNTAAKFAFVFLLLVGFVGSVASPRVVHAALPLALDGVGTPENCQYQFCSESLTTTIGHDVIILFLYCGAGGVCNVTDSSGLRFVQRISYTGSCCFNWVPQILEFYAVATSPLKSDDITVVGDGCCGGVQVVAVSGANTRAIFDPNPSIPATVSCAYLDNSDIGAYIDPCSRSIQTSTTDFVIAATAINDAGPCGRGYPNGVVPGFTNIMSSGDFEVDYTITTSPQTTAVFSCYDTDATATVVDAISFYGAFGT